MIKVKYPTWQYIQDNYEVEFNIVQKIGGYEYRLDYDIARCLIEVGTRKGTWSEFTPYVATEKNYKIAIKEYKKLLEKAIKGETK